MVRIAVLPSLLVLLLGCAGSRYQLAGPPAEPFDAVIIPGCPSEDDGALSRCQLGRAGLAALVWRKGWAKYFITSGGAVHSPYVEAEAIGLGMRELGVPADRILLDSDALHTDENMWNGWQIAKALGLKRVAVASNGGQASWGCQMLEDWGLEHCVAIPMDISELETFMPPFEPKLKVLRAPIVKPWIGIVERERQRTLQTGRTRPASMFLYPALGYLKWIGKPWRPLAPERPVLVTLAQRLARR